MKKTTLTLLLLGTVLQAENNIAVGAKFGTLGFGLDASMPVNDKVNLRLNVNKGSLDLDASDSDLTQNGSFDLLSAGVLADYHPMQNGFRISGGLYYNGNKLDVTSGEKNKKVKVGKHDYDFTKDSKTKITIDTKNIAPYIGIGWGNTFTSNSPWSFNVDLGVLYQGAVKTKMSMSGTAKDHNTGETIDLATNAQFLEDAKNERNFIDDNTKGIEWYPVVSVGVSYRF